MMCSISGCTAIRNSIGIWALSSCNVVNNHCRGNRTGSGSGAGILVFTLGCRVDSNEVADNDNGIYCPLYPSLIIRNSAVGNMTNFNIVAGNNVGPISSDAATATSPWANFTY